MGRPVNTSTDVYSLGAVLYELLTGACAQHLDSTSPAEIERVICLQEVPPPSATKPGLPRRSRQHRHDGDAQGPGSPLQFGRPLRRRYPPLSRRPPVLARKDSLAYRAGKFVRRNRLTIAAAVLVAASLVSGIFIAVSQARRAQRRLTVMVELANRSLFDVHSAIERLPGAMDARREIVKTTIAYLENLSKDAGQDDDLRLSIATAYWRLGDIQGYADKPNLGDLKGALASFTSQPSCCSPCASSVRGTLSLSCR